MRDALGSSSIIGIGNRYGLKVLRKCCKRVELKVRNFGGLFPMFVEHTWEKPVELSFCPPSCRIGLKFVFLKLKQNV